MNKFLILGILILALLFGLSSISQSYATAKQAQAAIEANLSPAPRTARGARTSQGKILEKPQNPHRLCTLC